MRIYWEKIFAFIPFWLITSCLCYFSVDVSFIGLFGGSTIYLFVHQVTAIMIYREVAGLNYKEGEWGSR